MRARMGGGEAMAPTVGQVTDFFPLPFRGTM